MRTVSSIALTLLLTACATPGKVSVKLDFAGAPAGFTTISVNIQNLDERATTPLLVEVAVEEQQDGAWSQPKPVLHPAAFVLKKQEHEILRVSLKGKTGKIRATVTVKEQETGRLLEKQSYEKVLSGTTSPR